MSVLTYGNGSHGVVALSQGGGGGLGGDSSATSTAFGFKNITKFLGRPNYNIDLTVSTGGTGQAGGNGGAVDVTLTGTDAQPSADPAYPVLIRTGGDYASGVLATSIGGGGGNAGFGSGSTQNGTSSATALKLTVVLGAHGGAGGTGGAVNVSGFPGTVIATAGDTAYGILAQSIGGGGGSSSGGSYSLGLPSISTINKVISGESYSGPGAVSPTITLKVGTAGGTGGAGGLVNVNLQGSTIMTLGEAAAGILAQSVGSGGGVAGSAGSGGSSDNPSVWNQLVAGKKFVNGVVGYLLDIRKAIKDAKSEGDAVYASLMALFPTPTINLSFGGDGGTGGNGGPVTVTAPDTSITTQGPYAYGIQAQSVGGGGGTGGAAVSGGSQGAGNLMKINFNLALGGTGGAGGFGAAVNVGLGGTTITTAGYAAYGLFAQSIGGGGGSAGSAETNSNGYFTLGASGTSGTASGGNGGSITVSQTGTAISRITTRGDVAHGMLLQSIGGGGGVAGQGFALELDIIGAQYPLSRTFGVGSNGGYGNGASVVFDPAALPYLAIATTGASAYGILAQSIGGGGGLGFQNPGQQATGYVGGTTSQASIGGEVAIRLRDGSTITTSGDGSNAILAQSVGGGGGIFGFAAGPAQVYEANSNDGSGNVTNGNGGSVTVSTGVSTIATTGAGAFGIFAQSVGAGGGLKIGGDGRSWVAGTTGAPESVGTGGIVTVTQAGTLSATGKNAIGIFAQSIGQSGAGLGASGGVRITVNGSVLGGSGGQGWGIWVDTDDTTNTITIAQGGSVGAVSDLAINAAGYGVTNVVNDGTVTGTYNLVSNNATRGTFTNNAGALLVPAGMLRGTLVNAGAIRPAAANAFAPITVAGSFRQAATGVYAPNARFTTAQADLLAVTDNADLSGTVLPQITSVLPNIALPVLTVAGSATGNLAGGQSTLFGYGVSRSGNQYLVSATSADFTPPGISLPASRTAVAQGLQSIWDAGGTPELGPLFASLGNDADTGQAAYSAQLRQLSPDSTLAPGASGAAAARSFVNNALSCPTFQGTTAMLVEGECAWMRMTGHTAAQHGGEGVTDYRINSVTWQIGGQYALAPGWLIGGSLAYEQSRLSSSDQLDAGRGQSGYGAVTLKYQTGPWLLSVAAFGGAGQFDTSRTITLLGLTQVAKGNPATSNVGMLLRATYTIGQESFYLRPNLSVGVVRVGIGGYRESGAGALNLTVDSAAQTSFVASPMLEIGARIALREEMVLRPYLAAGIGLQSSGAWTQTSRLTTTPVGTGAFTTSLPLSQIEGRVSAGVQLQTGGMVDLRLQYDSGYSGTITAHAGSFVAAIRF